MENEPRTRRYENAAKLALVLALILAAVHLGLLVQGNNNAYEFLDKCVAVAAIALPGIGGACVALQSAARSHHLAHSYKHYAAGLEQLEIALIGLIQIKVPHQTDVDRSFKRIVFDAEQLLNDELQVWWLITRTSEPKAGP